MKVVATELLKSACEKVRKDFQQQKYILSYSEYLEVFSKNPERLVRNSAQYMYDMFNYFGFEETRYSYNIVKRNFKIFERPRGRNKPPIIGQENAHEMIYNVIEQFVRQGKIDKLILLHGPNGSGKSSTSEAIAHALEEYSHTEEGAVYRFNWIFPTDKIGYEGLGDNNQFKHIGFGNKNGGKNSSFSFAHLEDDDILCKIISEMKENPILILPKEERINLYKEFETKLKNNFEVPTILEEGALSAKNKKIFHSLLLAYSGDLEKVLQHVQVERFFYSSRYRTGIATVEPQMAIDAQDKQINVERNLQNIPPVLQNIRIYEPQGELIDANRGYIEFSDLLKRPLEAFKYLISTIEKMSINLTSGFVDLDLIMLGSSNEKHLDAFKNSPDWPSFKGRFELIRVPYLLISSLEVNIYEDDVKIIERNKKIGPHALRLLSKWAVLTRLRQPDPEFYDPTIRPIISRLDPYDKLALYDGEELSNAYTENEKSILKKNVEEILKESQTSIAYEGRFGASPREMKMILYFSAQNESQDCVSALSIFNEIEKLIRDRSVYDYLQFEPRSGYHDFKEFIRYIKTEYSVAFHREFLAALNFYDEEQYLNALQKYMRHVSSYIKKEKIINEITGRYEDASENIMEEMEDLMSYTGSKKDIRERLVAKLASWKVENPNLSLNFSKIFEQELNTIAKRIYESKQEVIEKIKDGMMMYESKDYQKVPKEIFELCENTFYNLEKKFGYSKITSWESLIFMSNLRKNKN